MRLFAFALSNLTLSLATAAWSAEAGTYRQGQAYRSLPAAHPNQCISACQVDYTCRSWNFVKVNMRAAGGVCELNVRDAVPQPSPVSISGARLNGKIANVIPAGSRTLRVGEVPHYQPGKTLRVGAVPKRQPARIKRNEPSRPAFAPAPKPAVIPAYAPAVKTQTPPTITRRRPARTNRSDVQAIHPDNRLEKSQGTAVAKPQTNPAPLKTAQAVETRTMKSQAASRPARSKPANYPELAGAPAENTQQKLLGGLYDDVTAPKALTLDNLIKNPDAPIATLEKKSVSEIE